MNSCKICNRKGCIAELLRKLCEISGNCFEDFDKIPHNNNTDLILSKYIAKESIKKTKIMYNFLKKHNLLSEEMENKYKNLNIKKKDDVEWEEK